MKLFAGRGFYVRTVSDFPFTIYHLSFAIGEFKFEVQQSDSF